jgi:hypothetical protein
MAPKLILWMTSKKKKKEPRYVCLSEVKAPHSQWMWAEFWHGYVLREGGTHCILIIAHIALCKSRLTPTHCISLIVYLTSDILHLTSYTLRLTSYILHLTSHILHLTPYILHLTLYILHLTPYTLRLTSYALRLTSYILHLTPYVLHLTSYILHLTSYVLHLTSYIYTISYRIVFCTVWHVYVLCVRHTHDPMLLP